ncbi:hypothetical protein cypCar_00009569, partial [Cyprinus carpio]
MLKNAEDALWIDQWPSIRWLLMNEMRVGGTKMLELWYSGQPMQ